MPTEAKADPPGDPADPEPDQTPTDEARTLAVSLARCQATDAEIMASLRAKFSGTRPQVIPPTRLARGMKSWAPILQDARIAGRLDIALALHGTATDPKARDRTTAAIHLSRHLELLDRLGPDLDRKRKALLAMSDDELRGELERVADRLGLELHPKAAE